MNGIIAPTLETRRNGAQRAMIVLAFAMMLIAALGVVSFAGGPGIASTIEGGVKNGMEELYDIMTAVVIPVGAVVLAWCGFQALFGGQRGMETAKKTALTVVVVLAVVWLAPMIINQVSGWFSNGGAGNKGSVFG